LLSLATIPVFTKKTIPLSYYNTFRNASKIHTINLASLTVGFSVYYKNELTIYSIIFALQSSSTPSLPVKNLHKAHAHASLNFRVVFFRKKKNLYFFFGIFKKIFTLLANFNQITFFKNLNM
jgi:hypothetical protein